MSKKNIDLIRQALGAAESSIKLAKQLLNDLESGKTDSGNGQRNDPNKNIPGLVGSFDGENMVTASGEKFPVPENYASKSLLVVGDTLKMVEEGKEKRFKQIEHVKRYRTNGIITKKEGKWKAITPEGSYKVSPAAIEHLGADVGSEVILHLPANNLSVAYAALEAVKNANKPKESTEAVETIQEKPEVKPDSTIKTESKTATAEKDSSKTAEKVVEKLQAPKKETPNETKTVKEIKKEEKPKPEVAEARSSETKVAVAKETSVSEVKVAATNKVVPETVVEPVKVAQPTISATEKKPMEIAPEEDELT